MSLPKELLEELYFERSLSMAQIAEHLGCSVNKVVYWMDKYRIKRRDISEAIYHWHNPGGDPFDVNEPENGKARGLFQLGLGLYIGEGKKRDKHHVSLANSEPRVIRTFLRFLREICGVEEERIWAWINIFDDADLEAAQAHWLQVTGLSPSQFYKPVVRPRRGGTYQDLSEYGTLTVGVSSTKLREIVLQWCEDYLNRYG